jgi:hypothetical protein
VADGDGDGEVMWEGEGVYIGGIAEFGRGRCECGYRGG